MIRVLLVDDQALVRSGFRIILETEPDIEVVGEASNGVEAVELAATLTPDVICMDIEMPEMNGVEAARRILAQASNASAFVSAPASASAPSSASDTSVLILTTFGHEEYLFDALAAGVSGFLVKTARAEQLIDAVRTLAAGGALLGTDVTRAVMKRATRSAASAPAASAPAAEAAGAGAAGTADAVTTTGTAAGGVSEAGSPAAVDPLKPLGLTEREGEVLRHLATGASNAEIATALFVGEATVKTHVSNLLQKLGVRDRIQAVVWAHTHGVA